jgi:flagellum-specific peptidoglycan hydrolase FlgJ
MTPVEFIKTISDAARASMAKTKIPASFTIAEGALESGWAKSALVVQARNLFGVKADPAWHGEVLTMDTPEFLKGQWVTVSAKWRKYADWQACMDDHAQFLLTNRRYAHALTCKDGESFAQAVAAAGYATDPKYADKLISVMRTHDLAQFDIGVAPA